MWMVVEVKHQLLLFTRKNYTRKSGSNREVAFLYLSVHYLVVRVETSAAEIGSL